MTKWILLVLACCCVCGLLFFARANAPSELEAARQIAIEESPEEPQDEQRAVVPLESADRGAPPQTARSYLSSYWGPKWQELEPVLTKAGLDLDQPFEPEPWESVAGKLEQLVVGSVAQSESSKNMLVDWPADLHSEEGMARLRQELEIAPSVVLDEADVHAIEMETASFNDRLAALTLEYDRKLGSRLQEAWRNGSFVKAPLTTQGLSPGGEFYSATHVVGSWAVAIGLSNQDCPDLIALHDEAATLRTQRAEAAWRYLKGRGY